MFFALSEMLVIGPGIPLIPGDLIVLLGRRTWLGVLLSGFELLVQY